MVHRLALVIGGLGATGLMGLAVVIGTSPAGVNGAIDAIGGASEAAVADAEAPAPANAAPGVRTVVDTVYVRPPAGSQFSTAGTGNRSPAAGATLSPTPSGDVPGPPRADGRHGFDDRDGARDADRHHDAFEDGFERHDDDDDDHGRNHGPGGGHEDRSGPDGGDDDDHSGPGHSGHGDRADADDR